MKSQKIIFKNWKCFIEKGTYSNGRIALELIHSKDGEPVLVATINIPEIFVAKDEVIIKNYSENEGVLELLINANIISKPLRMVESSFITAPICRLL